GIKGREVKKIILIITLLITSNIFANTKVVTIGSTNNFPPINLLDENKQLTGFGKEISDAVFKKQGYQVRRKHSKHWSEVLDWLKQNEIAVIHDAGLAKERADYLDFSIPIVEMDESIFVREGNSDISSLSDLRRRKVACVKQHITHLYLKKLNLADCVIVLTPEEGIHALVNNRVEAFIYPREIVQYFYQHLGFIRKIKIVGKPLRRLRWAMAVKKGNTALLKDINLGIKAIKISGEFDQIYKKWYGQRPRVEGYSLTEVLVIGSFVLMIIVSIFLLVHLTRLRVQKNIASKYENSAVLFQTIFDTMPSSVFWKDVRGRYLGCNKAFRDSVKVKSLDSIIGKTDFEMPWKELAHLYWEDDSAVMLSGKSKVNFEEPLKSFDGTDIWLVTTKIPLVNTNGKIYGVLGIFDNITDRKNAELELIRAKDEALSASKAKSSFLANMSHELRTPLHGIMGFAQIGIKKSQKDDLEKYYEYFQTIKQSSQRLLALVNDVLDLSKLESGKMTLHKEDCYIMSMMERCVQEQESVWKSKKLNISYDLSTGVSTVYGDKKRIEQVIMNFFSNAIKFSPEQGTIVFSTRRSASSVIISIIDEGVGVPDADRDAIFSEFYQTEKGKVGLGTGLGLAICYEIIMAHKGKIWCSNNMDAGAKFSFEISLTGASPKLE
ncbi:MAG: transporter substrate-binding domain-containing protein, partial [Flavobacteriaceae bacterium]|nr:transporter substrate-binding domain-containing protein [Flavobacteriaceae bacterium]